MALVHIYCGDGKGKTSAAVGMAVRAAGRGLKVVMVRFLKSDDSGEVAVLGHIPGITVIPCERTFGFVSAMDRETREQAARWNLEQFFRAVELAERADLLILDEIMAAMTYGMVPEERAPGVSGGQARWAGGGTDPADRRRSGSSEPLIMCRRSKRSDTPMTGGFWQERELSIDFYGVY